MWPDVSCRMFISEYFSQPLEVHRFIFSGLNTSPEVFDLPIVVRIVGSFSPQLKSRSVQHYRQTAFLAARVCYTIVWRDFVCSQSGHLKYSVFLQNIFSIFSERCFDFFHPIPGAQNCYGTTILFTSYISLNNLCEASYWRFFSTCCFLFCQILLLRSRNLLVLIFHRIVRIQHFVPSHTIKQVLDKKWIPLFKTFEEFWLFVKTSPFFCLSV